MISHATIFYILEDNVRKHVFGNFEEILSKQKNIEKSNFEKIKRKYRENFKMHKFDKN